MYFIVDEKPKENGLYICILINYQTDNTYIDIIPFHNNIFILPVKYNDCSIAYWDNYVIYQEDKQFDITRSCIDKLEEIFSMKKIYANEVTVYENFLSLIYAEKLNVNEVMKLIKDNKVKYVNNYWFVLQIIPT